MTKMIKSVLMVNKEYFPHIGGIETIVRQLAEEWVKRGIRTTVLCTGEFSSEEEINGVIVIRTPVNMRIGSARISLSYLKKFRELAESADVIHFHYPNPIGEAALLLFGIKPCAHRQILCSYHSDALRPSWLVPLYNSMTKRFLEKCDRIVYASPEYLNSSAILSGQKSKTVLIPYGVSKNKFGCSQKRENSFAESLVSSLPHPRILFTGRLTYYKGLRFLLEAVARLPECSLVIIGDGSERDAVEKLSKSLNITSRVKILPPLEENLYPAIFTTGDVFVLPSTFRTEAFGLVGIEAMMSGLPIVTTDLGTGTTFYNIDRVTGRVAHPSDSQHLAECIQWILEKKERKQELGENAKRRAEALFCEEKMLESYWHEYVNGKKSYSGPYSPPTKNNSY